MSAPSRTASSVAARAMGGATRDVARVYAPTAGVAPRARGRCRRAALTIARVTAHAHRRRRRRLPASRSTASPGHACVTPGGEVSTARSPRAKRIAQLTAGVTRAASAYAMQGGAAMRAMWAHAPMTAMPTAAACPRAYARASRDLAASTAAVTSVPPTVERPTGVGYASTGAASVRTAGPVRRVSDGRALRGARGAACASMASVYASRGSVERRVSTGACMDARAAATAPGRAHANAAGGGAGPTAPYRRWHCAAARAHARPCAQSIATRAQDVTGGRRATLPTRRPRASSRVRRSTRTTTQTTRAPSSWASCGGGRRRRTCGSAAARARRRVWRAVRRSAWLEGRSSEV